MALARYESPVLLAAFIIVYTDYVESWKEAIGRTVAEIAKFFTVLLWSGRRERKPGSVVREYVSWVDDEVNDNVEVVSTETTTKWQWPPTAIDKASKLLEDFCQDTVSSNPKSDHYRGNYPKHDPIVKELIGKHAFSERLLPFFVEGERSPFHSSQSQQ